MRSRRESVVFYNPIGTIGVDEEKDEKTEKQGERDTERGHSPSRFVISIWFVSIIYSLIIIIIIVIRGRKGGVVNDISLVIIFPVLSQRERKRNTSSLFDEIVPADRFSVSFSPIAFEKSASSSLIIHHSFRFVSP